MREIARNNEVDRAKMSVPNNSEEDHIQNREDDLNGKEVSINRIREEQSTRENRHGK